MERLQAWCSEEPGPLERCVGRGHRTPIRPQFTPIQQLCAQMPVHTAIVPSLPYKSEVVQGDTTLVHKLSDMTAVPPPERLGML